MQDLRKLNDEPKMTIHSDGIGISFADVKAAPLNYYRADANGDTKFYFTKDYTSAVSSGSPVGKKYDDTKPMYALVPANALEEVTKVLTAGMKKYNEPMTEENWRKVEFPMFRYYSAAMRHMEADRRGEMIDVDKVNPDGSISKGTDCYHLACAIASLMFMLQLRMEAGSR